MKRRSVGVGVLDDPSEKSDLDGPIFPHTELPPNGGRDVEDAIPYDSQIGLFDTLKARSFASGLFFLYRQFQQPDPLAYSQYHNASSLLYPG